MVLAGRPREELALEERQKWENMSLEEHLAIYEKEGMSRKDAMKQVAKDRGIPVSYTHLDVYKRQSYLFSTKSKQSIYKG